MVNYGDTVIIAAIKSEVAEPEVNEPERGFLGKFYYLNNTIYLFLISRKLSFCCRCSP